MTYFLPDPPENPELLRRGIILLFEQMHSAYGPGSWFAAESFLQVVNSRGVHISIRNLDSVRECLDQLVCDGHARKRREPNAFYVYYQQIPVLDRLAML